jgi:hypothetical protein
MLYFRGMGAAKNPLVLLKYVLAVPSFLASIGVESSMPSLGPNAMLLAVPLAVTPDTAPRRDVLMPDMMPDVWSSFCNRFWNF